MDFIGKVCPYCKTAFKEGDDVVVCSICEMPHHKDCWIENKACTTFGCTGTIAGAEETERKNNFCTSCGAMLNEGQKFCTGCGTAVGDTRPMSIPTAPPMGTYTPPSAPPYTPPSAAPYTPPSAAPYTPPYTTAYTATAGSGVNDSELNDFIATNQEYYVPRYKEMTATNSIVSWNWTAFLFSYYWFANRKMYAIAALMAASSFLFAFMGAFGYFMSASISVGSGLFGNFIYKKYIDKSIEATVNMDAYTKSQHISSKGGTSAGGMWLFIGIGITIAILTSAIGTL